MNTTEKLNSKWWYRLLKLIFLVTMVLSVIVCFVWALNSKSDYIIDKSEVKILDDLYHFAEARKGEKQINAVPDFFKKPGEPGCLDTDFNVVRSLQFDEVEEIKKNIECPPNFSKSNSIENEEDRKLFKNVVCLTYEEYKGPCRSDRIVLYKKNLLFYGLPVLFTAGFLIIFVIVGFLFKKALIYVLFGNQK